MKIHEFVDPSTVALYKKGRGHIYGFPVSTMRIFSKLCTRLLTGTLLLFPPEWMKTILNCAIIDNEVAGRRSFAKSGRNGGFLTENYAERRISTPP